MPGIIDKFKRAVSPSRQPATPPNPDGWTPPPVQLSLRTSKGKPERGANPGTPNTPPARKAIESPVAVPKEGSARAAVPHAHAQWHQEMAQSCSAFGVVVYELKSVHALKGIEKTFTREDFERILALKKTYIDIQAKLGAADAPRMGMEERTAKQLAQDHMSLNDALVALLLNNVVWNADLTQGELGQLNFALKELQVDPECADVVSRQTPAKEQGVRRPDPPQRQPPLRKGLVALPITEVRKRDQPLIDTFKEAGKNCQLAALNLRDAPRDLDAGKVFEQGYSRAVYRQVADLTNHLKSGQEATKRFDELGEHMPDAVTAYQGFQKSAGDVRRSLEDKEKGLQAVFADERFTGEGLNPSELRHLSNLLRGIDPKSEIISETVDRIATMAYRRVDPEGSFDRLADTPQSDYSIAVYDLVMQLEAQFKAGRESETSYRAREAHSESAQRAFEALQATLLDSRALIGKPQKGLPAIFADARFTGRGLSAAQLWHLSNVLRSFDGESESISDIADRVATMKPFDSAVPNVPRQKFVDSDDVDPKSEPDSEAVSEPEVQPEPKSPKSPLSPRDRMKSHLGSPLKPVDPEHQARMDQRASDRIARQLGILANPKASKDELLQIARLLPSITDRSPREFDQVAQKLIAGFDAKWREELGANLLKLDDLPAGSMPYMGSIAKAVAGNLVAKSLLIAKDGAPWLAFDRVVQLLLAASPPMGVAQFQTVIAGIDAKQRAQIAANLLKPGDLPAGVTRPYAEAIVKAVAGELISNSLLIAQDALPWLAFDRVVDLLRAPSVRMGVPEFEAVATDQLRNRWSPEQRRLLRGRLNQDRTVSPAATPYLQILNRVSALLAEEDDRKGGRYLSPDWSPTPRTARSQATQAGTISPVPFTLNEDAGNASPNSATSAKDPAPPSTLNVDEGDDILEG